MNRLFPAAVPAVSGVIVLAGCSGQPASAPAPTTMATAAATTSAAPAACSNLFELGMLVKAELADVTCREPNGLVGVNHKAVCTDGRVMIFDSAVNTYGFPGVFAKQDTDAESQYAKDYAKCLGR